MNWTQKQDELEAKGWRVENGRLRYPDGFYGAEYPRHWTAEMCMNEAYAHVALLERECSGSLQYWNSHSQIREIGDRDEHTRRLLRWQ
jgi:hypothetical protein